MKATAPALLLPLWLLLVSSVAVPNEQRATTANPGFVNNDWNATAKLNLNGTAGIRSLNVTMTVPSHITADNSASLAGMSLFVGIYMQPTFKGVAPVAAGTMLTWTDEYKWKARVAHRSSTSNSKEGFVYWTHELDVNANDTLVSSMSLVYQKEALEYTTSVINSVDNSTTNATEHIFLVNNRRVGGFFAGIFMPYTSVCYSINTQAMASITVNKFEPLHDTTNISSKWVLYPTTNKPFETPNKCRSVFTANNNENFYNITALLHYTAP